MYTGFIVIISGRMIRQARRKNASRDDEPKQRGRGIRPNVVNIDRKVLDVDRIKEEDCDKDTGRHMTDSPLDIRRISGRRLSS